MSSGDEWWNSPGLASLAGLLPLLAVSRSIATGLALGIASLAVLCIGNVVASGLAPSIPSRFRAPALLVLIAALVSAVDLVFRAQWFSLYDEVGLFVPLIVTNGVIIARAGAVVAYRGWWQALLEGLRYGTGFIVLLAGVGALREWLAPFLLVLELPAGVLFLLAGGIALRQAWLLRRNGA